MSILIKGMEMPTTCRKCGFYHHSVDYGYYDFEYCGANNQEFNNAYDSTKPHINPFEEKLSGCPLVPVTPHGDLIGREWLIDIAHHLMNTAKNDDIANGVKWLWQYIIEAPTVLEAEEGE